MSKFCPNCGNMLDDNAMFCDKCGKAFEAPAAPQPAQPAAPAQQYSAPQQQYGAPQQQYGAPQQQYGAPQQQYGAPKQQYGAPQQQYGAPQQQYGAPQQQYGAPQQQYGAPQQQYGAPQQYGGAAVATKKNPLEGVLKFVKEKKIFFIGGAALLVVIIVLCIIIGSCASNSPKGALEKAFKCAQNLDVKGAFSLSYETQFDKDATQDSINKEIEEEQSMINSSGMASTYKTMLKGAKLNITKDEKLVQSKVDELKADWSYSYKDTDKITEIHELTYSITGFGSSSESTCYAVKVNGKWYIKGMSGLF